MAEEKRSSCGRLVGWVVLGLEFAEKREKAASAGGGVRPHSDWPNSADAGLGVMSEP